jgi:V/A-type H+-transporting ATPase subunit B
MDLNVNIPIEQALDLCWDILARYFEPVQTGLKNEMINEFWPAKKGLKKAA